MTQWGACVQTSLRRATIIFFRVFRPCGRTSQTSCYSLVGTNIIRATTTNSCVTVNVLEDDQISVQPKDAVGLFFRESSNPVETDDSIDTITVWFAPEDSFNIGNDGCPYKIGSDGNLNYTITSAPVITAMVGK